MADDDVRGLVAAIVVPLVEVVAELDGWYARFQARTRWDTEAWAALAERRQRQQLRRRDAQAQPLP